MTRKVTQKEFDFYMSVLQVSPRTCTACKSIDTEALTELTHVCNECGNIFHLDNLPPTPEDEAREDAMNMFCPEDF